jgi:hypothetical protein
VHARHITVAAAVVVASVLGCLRGAVAAPPLPQLFIAPGGNDGTMCKRRSPCASFDRAYRVAKRGQVVEVAGGVYPAQRITPDPAKASGMGMVTFVPAAGASVSVGKTVVRAGAAHVAFERMTFREGWEVGPADGGTPAEDVAFRRTKGPVFYILNARNVRVVGGEYGPSVDAKPQIKVWNPSNSYAPTNILVDGVHLHDFTRSGSDVHTECLQIYAGQGVTIRRNRFRNCDGTGSLHLGAPLGSAPITNVLVENNMFEAGDGVDEPYYDVQASLCIHGLVFRYNTMVKGGVFFNCDRGNGPAAIVGNYSLQQSQNVCRKANVRYSHNVWVGRGAARCAGSDRTAGALKVVGPNDLRLMPGAAPIGWGDPKEYPRTDAKGAKRPSGARPDAGADERLVAKPKRKQKRR